MNIILHGDVDILPVDSIPEGLKKINFNGSYVVRHGESGNKHIITAERTAVDIYLDEKTGMHYFKVNSAVEISHEQHKTLVIAPGIYKEDAETEYNPFEKMLRKVQD